jgi:CBS domain-containing protein
MRASDIMSSNVLTVGPDARIDTVIDLMVNQRISGVPIVEDDGTLVGMLTERDLLRRVETETEAPHRRSLLSILLGAGDEATAFVRSHSRRVSDIMTEKVFAVAEDTPLVEVVEQMEKHHIRRVPVLREGKLVGIVSRLDLVRALAARLAAEKTVETGLPDQELQARARAALARVALFDSSNIVVTVDNGLATIEGVIHDERLRPAIRVAVEGVPGIREVADKVVFVEPVTGSVYPA